MSQDFHLLRPYWLLLFVPLGVLFIYLWRINPQLRSWSAICDEHLLPYLLRHGGKSKRRLALTCLFVSIGWIVISLAGPAWSKYPVLSYTMAMPRVVLLDMSDAMLARDLPPDRLTRAKFLLHDLFNSVNTAHSNLTGQFGLVVFTAEPFVVSPLTDDAKTIDALLDSVTPDVMPVAGYRLDLAMQEAVKLIHQSGYQQGQLVVLSAETPNAQAINVAGELVKQGISTSVMPILPQHLLGDNELFRRLAREGGGELLAFSDAESPLQEWVKLEQLGYRHQFMERDNIPIWRDEGRWFLIPALLFMLPVFRRGWLQRVLS